ncbi:meiotically upregulated Mug184 [Schizosaccharomyces cryophilus OY26]|uniref:Meiotically upregulated Mug184 n=1 Tax=Schizosaccharomyces cryophilus (strain OY26 / ATCC MYA-4695 / CBS 11777 / NBRC 106824 / NRRL Y48691) TaxID=653667 RepID=S9XHG5_SCHCR|nr:meiotically upregulated Mug184 [Schizosaccharomyces cryophilus OY26]EPY53121.1 meiotically upregulated Mug184 [Schizosaccharomyces cryophilus OY26]
MPSKAEFDIKADYYSILEVSKNATAQEVRKQYLALAFKYHPDRNYGNESTAAKKFQKVQTAYDVLKDVSKRRVYDSHYSSNSKTARGFKSKDSFRSSFSSRKTSAYAAYHEANKDERYKQDSGKRREKNKHEKRSSGNDTRLKSSEYLFNGDTFSKYDPQSGIGIRIKLPSTKMRNQEANIPIFNGKLDFDFKNPRSNFPNSDMETNSQGSFEWKPNDGQSYKMGDKKSQTRSKGNKQRYTNASSSTNEQFLFNHFDLSTKINPFDLSLDQKSKKFSGPPFQKQTNGIGGIPEKSTFSFTPHSTTSSSISGPSNNNIVQENTIPSINLDSTKVSNSRASYSSNDLPHNVHNLKEASDCRFESNGSNYTSFHIPKTQGKYSGRGFMSSPQSTDLTEQWSKKQLGQTKLNPILGQEIAKEQRTSYDITTYSRLNASSNFENIPSFSFNVNPKPASKESSSKCKEFSSTNTTFGHLESSIIESRNNTVSDLPLFSSFSIENKMNMTDVTDPKLKKPNPSIGFSQSGDAKRNVMDDLCAKFESIDDFVSPDTTQHSLPRILHRPRNIKREKRS